MPESLFNILESILFFVFLGLTFKALMASRIPEMFIKGAIWQIQIVTIFLSLALAYLVTQALMRLIEISTSFIG
jgi:uncharacterized membrane protein YwzB